MASKKLIDDSWLEQEGFRRKPGCPFIAFTLYRSWHGEIELYRSIDGGYECCQYRGYRFTTRQQLECLIKLREAFRGL